MAIARALVNHPPLLLADEPTASLDDASCAQVMALLLESAEAVGATVIIATHDRRVRERALRRLELAPDVHRED